MSGDGKSGGKSVGLGPHGRFAPGNPGKPKGARHKTTKAAESLLEDQARELTEAVIEAALGGDGTALKLCLDRILPPRRPGDRPIEMALPESPPEAMAAILDAVATGGLLLSDAERLAGLIKAKAELGTLADLEERLAALEAAR